MSSRRQVEISYAFNCEHTDRYHEAYGLCKKCYNHLKYAESHPNVIARGEYGTRTLGAVCHSDRPMYRSDGYCQSCFAKFRKYKVNFVAMYAEQEGNCKLCLTHFEEYELDVDHDHVTGKARGLVCTACNLAIAGAEHPMHALALAYLKKG